MPVPEPSRVRQAVDLVQPVLGARALLTVYRLLRVELARQRGVAIGVDLDADLDGAVADHVLTLLRTEGGRRDDDVAALAELHQRLLAPDRRKAAGAWFTPPVLVDHLLDEALEPTLDEARRPGEVTVLDPACGSGLFLVAALHRFVRRGVAVDQVLRHCVRGVELDPAAAELTRLSLWTTAVDLGAGSDAPDPHVHVADALDLAPVAPYDVVLGNPPFLNRLERRTAQRPEAGRRLAAASGGAVRAYTDLSAVFLHRAVSWVRRGGRVALVQPQSLLAARDAAGVRAHVSRTCSLESLWSSETPVFDASVLTCAPVLRVGATQTSVRRTHGASFARSPAVPPGDLTGTWSHLVAEALGVPAVWAGQPAVSGTVGDVADCTADFRDQYYGLAGHVHEAAGCPAGVPLVTTGLIDPARNAWRQRPTRFLKQRWDAPVVDLGSLAADAGSGRWARARLVPKVLVGTQGKVVEAVVDEGGRWLPSVPTITVVPRGTTPWRLLAVLLAPPVSALAATTYAGAGLTMTSVKLSARQVAQLPLPAGEEAWDQAARLVETAQRDQPGRLCHLEAMGRLMCAAYDVPADEVMPWWLARLR